MNAPPFCKRRRRIGQFGLRTLILAMLVLGPLLGWFGPPAWRAYRQWRAAWQFDARVETRSGDVPLTAPLSSDDFTWRVESSFPESDPPDVR